MITEAVTIGEIDEEKSMNSKKEWTYQGCYLRFFDGGGVFAQNGQNCIKVHDFCKICPFLVF